MKSSSNMTAARVPGAKFDKIVLHIGYWKTGTSAIQDSIVKNRKFLDELGYFTTYPRDPDLYFAFENPPNPKHEIYLRKGAKTEAQRMKIQQKKKTS